ncbi:hypothetical protein JTB14_003400 [Gonioctena quinquepunctata]|nr:hypothetical protein JTB14_003400 [Gonioctena quinquepunctata]
MNLLVHMSTGFDKNLTTSEPCIPCIEGIHSRLPFKPSSRQSSELLELVHSDLAGPMETASLGGTGYFFPLMDDDLSSESFLKCLTRFVARRGVSTDIYSDNWY